MTDRGSNQQSAGDLRDDGKRRLYERRMMQDLQNLRGRVENMWQEARKKEPELRFNRLRDDYYLQAIQEIQAAYNDWKNTLGNTQSALLDEFELLLEEARAEDEKARRRANLMTTALQLDQYLELLEELQDIQEHNPGCPIHVNDELGRPMGSMPVETAIDYVENKAIEFFDRKYENDYKGQALSLLREQHNPEGARELIQNNVLDNEYISDATRAAAEEFIEDIQPAPDRREIAEEARRAAEKALDDQDYLLAKKKLEEARETWPYLKALDDTEARLHHEALNYINDHMSIVQKVTKTLSIFSSDRVNFK